MRALESQIKAYNQAIADQTNTLMSIKGIEPVISASIIAEIGDINRFTSRTALAKYAGLAWNQHQSGEFDAENRHQILSGNRYLKCRQLPQPLILWFRIFCYSGSRSKWKNEDRSYTSPHLSRFFVF